MECLTSQEYSACLNDGEPKDLLDTKSMDEAFTPNQDEELPEVLYPRKSSLDRHASALSQERDKHHLHHPCTAEFARNDNLFLDAFETAAKRRPGALDQDVAVLLIKKEKKAKKVLYQHLTGFLSSSAKKQLPFPSGKKNSSPLNSGNSVISRVKSVT